MPLPLGDNPIAVNNNNNNNNNTCTPPLGLLGLFDGDLYLYLYFRCLYWGTRRIPVHPLPFTSPSDFHFAMQPTALYSSSVVRPNGAQISQKFRSQLKILGARWESCSKLHTEDPKISGGDVKHLVPTATLDLCTSSLAISRRPWPSFCALI